MPFVEHGVRKPAELDVLKGLLELQARAIDAERMSDGENKDLVDAYRDYVGLLLRVYEMFLEHT
jgi:hypothetical protein